MYIDRHIPNKREGEKLLLFLRRHWVFVLGHFLLYILLAFVPIGVYYLLEFTLPGAFTSSFSLAALLLLASIYYFFILLFLYTSFIDHHLDVWIITDQRIIYIEQKGMFNRKISAHSNDKIQDVTATQKGFLATFFTYGDVQVQTAGEAQMFIFRTVNNPFVVKQTINGLIKKYDTIADNPQ